MGQYDDYAGMWANGVNIGKLWDKIKTRFVAGFPGDNTYPAIDQTGYSATWKQQARANIGLTIGQNQIWYGSAANTIGTITTSTLGRKLLGSSIAANKIWYANEADNFTATDISAIGIATLNAQSNAAVSQLWATRATQDGSGNTITSYYAHGLAFATSNNETVLRLLSASGTLNDIAVNSRDGLLRLDNNAKVPLVHIPDSILGQMVFAGTVDEFIDHSSASPSTSVDLVKVTLTDNAATKLHEKISAITTSNKVVYLTTESTSGTYNSKPKVSYVDCEGMYFLWTSGAIVSGSAQMWSGERFQVGDWLISVGSITAEQGEDGWRKIDNTDAVTGVKGSNESIYRIDNVNIDALDVRALATYLTNTTQHVADDVQFDKNVWAQMGMAASGMVDMNLAETSGGGTVTGIMFKSNVPYATDNTYSPETGETVIKLPAYPVEATTIKSGLMSATDKVKLDGIEANATRVTESTVSGWGFTKNTGTVTSVAMTVPTGLSVSGSPITASGTLVVSLASGYTIPTTENVNKGVAAYKGMATLASAIGTLQGSLGSMAYRESDEFVAAEDMSASNIVNVLDTTPVNRATADADGNVVSSTYLKKSGGSMANTNLVTNLNADLLDGKHLSELFTSLSSNTTNAISATIGGETKNISPSTLRASLGLSITQGKFTESTTDDSEWFLVAIGDKKLYLRFTVNTGAFKLEIASDETASPTYTKEFAFATLSSAAINAICV